MKDQQRPTTRKRKDRRMIRGRNTRARTRITPIISFTLVTPPSPNRVVSLPNTIAVPSLFRLLRPNSDRYHMENTAENTLPQTAAVQCSAVFAVQYSSTVGEPRLHTVNSLPYAKLGNYTPQSTRLPPTHQYYWNGLPRLSGARLQPAADRTVRAARGAHRLIAQFRVDIPPAWPAMPVAAAAQIVAAAALLLAHLLYLLHPHLPLPTAVSTARHHHLRVLSPPLTCLYAKARRYLRAIHTNAARVLFFGQPTNGFGRHNYDLRWSHLYSARRCSQAHTGVYMLPYTCTSRQALQCSRLRTLGSLLAL